MIAVIRKLFYKIFSLMANDRIRTEAAWVLFGRLSMFVLSLVALKVYTNILGPAEYGLYNLVITTLLFMSEGLIIPINQSYLRYYHIAESGNHSRAAGVFVLRWYGIVTTLVVVMGIALSGWFGELFNVSRWLIVAAGAIFFANQWRVLCTTVMEIRRNRPGLVLYESAFLVLQIIFVFAATYLFCHSAVVALTAFALAAAVMMVIGMLPLLKRIFSEPHTTGSDLAKLAWTFGLPFGILRVCNVIQGMSSRYIINAYLDLDAVGAYVAVYQMSGIPYLLLMQVFASLVRPVAYQKTPNIEDAAALWKADKILIIGTVCFTAIGLSLLLVYLFFGERLVILATNSSFVLPTILIVVMAASRFLTSLTMFLQLFFEVHQEMGGSTGLKVFGALMTLVICIPATSMFGISGAVYGALISNFAFLLLFCFGPKGAFWIVRRTRHRVLAEAVGSSK